MNFDDIAKKILRMFIDIRLEVISRSGLIPTKSYIGNSSYFEAILSIVCAELADNITSICTSNENLDNLIKEYKDEFINRFMVLHHNMIVQSLKFNWND